MTITRNICRVGHINIGVYKFGRVVVNFKYLGVDINKNENSHEEIQIRLSAPNRYYFGTFT